MDTHRGLGRPAAIVYGKVYTCVISHCRYVFEAGSMDFRPTIIFPLGPAQECVIAIPGSVAYYDLSLCQDLPCINGGIEKSVIDEIWFPISDCYIPDDVTLKDYFSLSLV